MKNLKYFRIYQNWQRAFDYLNDEEVGQVIRALMNYAFDGIEPEHLDAVTWPVFHSLRAAIDVARSRTNTNGA